MTWVQFPAGVANGHFSHPDQLWGPPSFLSSGY